MHPWARAKTEKPLIDGEPALRASPLVLSLCRVLSRDGPVPLWRASGRLVQQALIAIRKAGVRGDDDVGGDGGEGGEREGGDSGSRSNNDYRGSRSRLVWGLLGLEAFRRSTTRRTFIFGVFRRPAKASRSLALFPMSHILLPLLPRRWRYFRPQQQKHHREAEQVGRGN